MAAANRKPSGSSTRSDQHSPLHSPGNAHTHSTLAPANNVFGVGMGSATGLKSLNQGWQVWGDAAPPTRDASASSGTAMHESIEGAQLYQRAERWNPRVASGGWDNSSQRMDLHAPFSNRNPRNRQRFDGAGGKDIPSPIRVANTSPTISAFGVASFPVAQPALSASSSMGSYDPNQNSQSVDDDLSAALRGMAVEHDNGLSQHPLTPPSATHSDLHAQRPPVYNTTQHQRPPYATFPQPDYSAYYNVPSRGDYPYPYDAYTTPDTMFASPALSAASAAPSVYPGMPAQHHAAPDMRGPQSGLFYDYSGSGRPGSQFYYPQAMLYPTGPGPTSGGQGPHKKRMQMTHQPPVLYSPVRSISSRPSPYHPGQTPLMIHSPGMYMQMPNHPQQQGGRGRRHEDLNAAFRSPLLEEFRNAKDHKWELKDIYGYVVEFSTDQHGSRFIQQKIETANEEEKQTMFDEIMPEHALRLIQDVFGNYVIQKFFEHGTLVQKTMIASAMEGHVLPLSLQMYGCRVVQKAIENVPPEQQSMFVMELEKSVLRCVKDANGNHVVQRLIESVPPERLTFTKAFHGHVYDLASHPYGCRVLQRCFENLPDDHTRPLLDELQRHSNHLMQDQFGNYVIQFVLEHGKPEDRALIISRLRGQMFHMSRHKFASNVVEKALVMSDSESRRVLIEEIMTPRPDGSIPLVSMMKDQFANYVLQRVLNVAEPDQKDAVIEIVKVHLPNMRKYGSHARQLIAIERLIQKCVTPVSTSGERTPVQGDIPSTDASTQ